jgi:hypothetical protein
MKTRKRQKSVKVGTTVFLSPEQRAALARLSARRDVSMGHLIREGITLVLARHNQKGNSR